MQDLSSGRSQHCFCDRLMFKCHHLFNADPITAGFRTYKARGGGGYQLLQLKGFVIGMGLQKELVVSSRHEEDTVHIWPEVGVVVDPLIKTPFNLKKRVVKSVYGHDHAVLLTPCLWRVVVMGYGPGECDPFQRHLNGIFPRWWPDFEAELHCFATWLCLACFLESNLALQCQTQIG